MTGAISTALPALLIIMSIGILIAAWMAGGVIPTMVYYGCLLYTSFSAME